MLGEASVARLPASERGATQRAQREEWASRKVPGKGGKGGIKTEYQPPHDILNVIHKFLKENPSFFSEMKESPGKPIKYKLHPPKKPLVSGSGEHVGHIINDHSTLDSDVLEDVLRQIECALEERKITLDPAKKANLIQLVYEYCVGTGKNVPDTIDRFLRLVS